MTVVIIIQQADETYNVYISGNNQNEVNNLPIQAAKARAREIIRKKGRNGYIITEKNDSSVSVEKV
jgi:hypothetical protein